MTAKQTMIDKLGGEDQYRQFLKDIASKGGKNSTYRGFRDKKDLAKSAGSAGGKKKQENRRKKLDT